jgi:hypothetical protein
MVNLKWVFSVVLTLAVTLSLDFLGNPALSVPYSPPTRKPPAQTLLSGDRSQPPSCVDSNQKIKDIIPLIPDYLPRPTQGENKDYYSLTLSEYPTLLVYLPKTNAQIGELVLREKNDKNDKSVIRSKFSLPNQAGIVRLNLADTKIKPLEPNKLYWWSVSIKCGSNDSSQDGLSDRIWFQRITPSATFKQQISNAQPNRLPALYAQGDENGGFWFDALSSLDNLRQRQPNNPALKNQWKEWLDSAKLAELAEQPLLDCCQLEQKNTTQL